MREELESRLYFYSKNIEGIRKFLKQVKFVMPVRHRDRSVIIMSMMEYSLSCDRIDTLLSEYAYYCPYC